MDELTLVLLQLFALFVAAKLLGSLASRLKMPSVVGEILAGVVIGNTLLRGALRLDGDLAFLRVLSELGVVFLIFLVGLETPFSGMRRVGARSLVVAILGVIVPFAAGAGLMFAMGRPTVESLFLAAALVATSVGITARVLGDMGVLGAREARIILGAAVIDDVLGLIVLTVVQAVGVGGDVGVASLAFVILQAALFVALLMWFGGRLAASVFGPTSALASRWEWTRGSGAVFAIAVAVCLGLSTLAAVIGLSAIVGAFLAGMAFAATPQRSDLVERFEGVVQFLTPFFFAFIGLQVDVGVAASVWPFALLVTLVAIATKVVGCGLGSWGLGLRSQLAIGVGMMPRGEVGIIVALIGLSLHLIPDSLYATVIAMSLLTTLVTPPLLVLAFRRLPPAPAA